jgi:hypothetical protein
MSPRILLARGIVDGVRHEVYTPAEFLDRTAVVAAQ